MLKQITYILCFFVIRFILAQNSSVLDSLLKSIHNFKKEDTIKAKLYSSIGKEYHNTQKYNSAIDILFRSFKIYKSYGDFFNAANQLEKISYIYFDANKLDKALFYAFESLKLSRKISDPYKRMKSENDAYYTLSEIYFTKGDNTRATHYYRQCLILSQKINEPLYPIYNGLGNVYVKESEKLVKKDPILNIDTIVNPSRYVQLLDSALYFYQLALKDMKKNNLIEKESISALVIYSNIGSIYFKKNEFNKALEFFSKAMNIAEKENSIIDLIIIDVNISNVYIYKNQIDKSIEYLKSALQLSLDHHIDMYLYEIYDNLSQAYVLKKDYLTALQYQQKKFIVYDSLRNIEKEKNFQELSVKYQTELKDSENKLLKAKNEKQRWVLTSTLVGLLLTFLLLLVIWRAFTITRKQKKIIEISRNELAEQKKIIEQKQQDILDSIHYASRIQSAILPEENYWKSLLPKSFVLYIPKDIVAGDFYWMVDTTEYIFLAAADCTGHGVPGAMLSVLCNNLLTESILEEKIYETDAILQNVRSKILDRLGRTNENIQDGMDIALLRLNKTDLYKAQFSGANRPLYIITNNHLEEIPYDKQPIGKYFTNQPFTKYNLHLNTDSCLYLFTDGFPDQFGGTKNKKLGTKNFKELVLKYGSSPIYQQHKLFHDFFLEWKNEQEQTDDVTLIGIKV
ncbi:MAG: hypothetical protein KatS3mg027_0850 [Bacteroidia bacterium]|nr:MAG: hypothetical protein KatS3mg027_0850 [Bacteroidia bacterium]